MWNFSALPSLLLPFADDYLSVDAVECESSGSQAAGAVGLDRMLAAEYDLCPTLHMSQSLQSLQTPTPFPMNGSHSYFVGGNSIYNGDSSPAFAHQLDRILPTTATHSMKWMAAGETVTGDGSRLTRGSKRLKTTTAATAQGPHRGLRCNAKPRNQPVKAPCKRSQKLGDKITALQLLVSPYGKTDTASVLQEAAACIKHLHQQIQILTASYPKISSPTSQQDPPGEAEEEGATTDLRRRGLCLAPLSPTVVELVSSAAMRGHRDMSGTGGCWRQLGTLL